MTKKHRRQIQKSDYQPRAVSVDGQLRGIQVGDKFYGDYESYDMFYGIHGRILSPHGEHVGWIASDGRQFIASDIQNEISIRNTKISCVLVGIITTVKLTAGDRRLEFLRHAGGQLVGLYTNYRDYLTSIGHVNAIADIDFVLPIQMEKNINLALNGEWQPLKDLCDSFSDDPLLMAVEIASQIAPSGRPKTESTQWMLHNADRLRSQHQRETGQVLHWYPDTWRKLLELVPTIHEDYAGEIMWDLQEALNSEAASKRLEERLRKARQRKGKP